MSLFRFLQSGSPQTVRSVMLLSLITGLFSAALAALVNTAAAVEGVDAEPVPGRQRLVLLFAIALAVMSVSKYHGMARLMASVEVMLKQLQLRICDKIRKAELRTMEALDQNRVFTAVSQNTRMISQAIISVSLATSQSFVLIFGLFYLATVSLYALLLYFIAAFLAFLYFRRRAGEQHEAQLSHASKGAEFFAYLSHLLFGFKEVQLSSEKNDELYADLQRVADNSEVYAMQSNTAISHVIVVTDFTMYMLAGTVVFILPQLIPTYTEVLTEATIAVMFTFAPIISIVSSSPQFSIADAALDALYRLEAELDAAAVPAEQEAPSGIFAGFESIELVDLHFSYPALRGAKPFSVGPLNLRIPREKIIFIVGGNGSGKSTVLKVITGLYPEKKGKLLVDGRPVTRVNRRAYRELFAGVFADFRMFPKLYGVKDPDPEEIQRRLRELKIEDKLTIENGEFSTTELSTGQRKRLAMLASLLEDRDFYVFDEWTADQDPEFRATFYDKLLPELKADNKTVIAITHDDRYWKKADWRVHLDYGKVLKVVEIVRPRNQSIVEIARDDGGQLIEIVVTSADGKKVDTLRRDPAKDESLEVRYEDGQIHQVRRLVRGEVVDQITLAEEDDGPAPGNV